MPALVRPFLRLARMTAPHGEPPPYLRLVIKLRYGLQLNEGERRQLSGISSKPKGVEIILENGRVNTLEDVGRIFDVTRERIRQIEVKALRKLKHPKIGGKKLRDYLE